MKPVFLTYTVEDLWAVVHPVALFGWGLILVAPFWRQALTVAYLPPLFHAVLYVTILIPKMMFPDPDNSTPPDLNNMKSIQALFDDPEIFFCGWIHYLAFDQLVGIAIAQDAITNLKVSKLVYYTIITVCFFLTFYLGPVGFLSYMVSRRILLGSYALKSVKTD